MIRIRPMTADDLPLGMRLKKQAGWNQTLADWQRFLTMQPEGCFVAEWEGAAAGTAVVTAFDAVAWVSMVLVDEAYRGRGIGKALMHRAIQAAEELGCTAIRLDATTLGQPLYASLGFEPQMELVRYAGIARAVDSAVPQEVRVARFSDLDAVLSLDASVTGVRRDKFLSFLFADAPREVRVFESDGFLAGYMTVRYGSEAVQLGPCIALTEEAGSALLTDAIRRHANSLVYWDAPSDNATAAEFAKSAGLTPQRQFLRMCRGEDVRDDVVRLWASSGPELG